MKVSTMYDDEVAMELVAHFLGIATHDNVNAAPSVVASRTPSTGTATANAAFAQWKPDALAQADAWWALRAM